MTATASILKGRAKLTGAQVAHAVRFAHGAQVATRLQDELRVLKLTCLVAVEAGHSVSLQDGEEWVVNQSRDVNELVMAAMSTDMDRLRIHDKDGKSLGVIAFVYGNSGSEVINDYHTSLEELLKPVNSYMNELSECGR